MSELPTTKPEPDDDRDPPGGPWKSWPAIYVTLAIWGVVLIAFLIWMTGSMNIGAGMTP